MPLSETAKWSLVEWIFNFFGLGVIAYVVLVELKRSPNHCEEILLALFSFYRAFQASLAILRGWICMKPIFLQSHSRKMFRDESPFHFWVGFLFYSLCSGGLLVRLIERL